MLLVDRSNPISRCRTSFAGGKHVVLVDRMRERECFLNLLVQLGGRQRFVWCVMLTLHRSAGRIALGIPEIYAVLSLASVTVAFQAWQVPILSEDEEASLFELVLVLRLRPSRPCHRVDPLLSGPPFL